MVIERRMVVGIEDIKAVSFECTSCKARLTRSPDSMEVPFTCPHCGAQWRGHEPMEPPIVRIVVGIVQLRKTPQKGFKLLFEFEEPKA